jgi:hypothetical protein
MPRFWDLFFWGLDVRKGWIGAGFVGLWRNFGVGKMLIGGLTSVFWAENSKRKQATAKTKAINQSRRPSGFAPAFGRAEPTLHAKSRAMNGAPGATVEDFVEVAIGGDSPMIVFGEH